MPPLDTPDNEQDDATIAIAAEALYLTNLLALPGVAFVAIIILFVKHKESPNNLARCHLKQTLSASIWAGILIIIATGFITVIGGPDRANTWMWVIIYFTTIHATLVLLGVVGLSKAMAGKHYHYPFIGDKCDTEVSS